MQIPGMGKSNALMGFNDYFVDILGSPLSLPGTSL